MSMFGLIVVPNDFFFLAQGKILQRMDRMTLSSVIVQRSPTTAGEINDAVYDELQNDVIWADVGLGKIAWSDFDGGEQTTIYKDPESK